MTVEGQNYIKRKHKEVLGTLYSGEADTELTPPYQSSEPLIHN